MVSIAKTFNDDMEDYLDRLYGKKERFVDVLKRQKKKPPVEKVPDSVTEEEVFVEYDDVRAGGFSSWLSSLFSRRTPEVVPDDLPEDEAKVLEELEDEIEELDHEIEDLEEVRETLWTRFLRSMRRSRSPSRAEVREDIMEEVVPSMDDDVRRTLKMLHGWLEQLPHGAMQEFKRSDDFRLYKMTLEKYGLVKKQ